MKRLGIIGGLALSILILSVTVFAGESPSFDLQGYGFVKLDAAYDQNPTSHGNYAMWVLPQSLQEDNPQFNMTHKSTRFGLNVIGKNYDRVDVNGNFEVDMYGGGGTENKAILLLRHAYFTLQSGSIKLLAGQSWDLISPLNPATLNYPVMWGAGNIQYRRPQVSLFWTAYQSGNTSAEIAGGMFRTIGSDLTPSLTLALGETSDGIDDGTDAAVPSFQGRFDVNHKSASGTTFRAGVSGLWGQLKSETNMGNNLTYESNVLAGHLMVSFANGFGFSGEYFTGANLGSYFGGAVNNSTIDGVQAQGGWVSAWVKPSKLLQFTGGYSYDDPDDADLSNGNRAKNSAMFGNVKFFVVPKVTIGMEVTQWETEYVGTTDAAKSLRFESSFILSF